MLPGTGAIAEERRLLQNAEDQSHSLYPPIVEFIPVPATSEDCPLLRTSDDNQIIHEVRLTIRLLPVALTLFLQASYGDQASMAP